MKTPEPLFLERASSCGAFVSDAGARHEEALSHGHVVECGAVAPLLIRTEKVVFNAGPRTLSLHAAYSPVATRADALLSNRGTYFVTASTYLKTHHFYAPQHLDVLHRGLLGVTRDFSWELEALAVFSNHYHFVVHSPRTSENASSLSQMLALLHARTAKWTNRLEGKPNRKVWHNFWVRSMRNRIWRACIMCIRTPSNMGSFLSRISINGVQRDGLSKSHHLRWSGRSIDLRSIS